MEMFKHENPETYRQARIDLIVNATPVRIIDIHPDDAYYDIKHRFIGVIGKAIKILSFDELPENMKHAYPGGDWVTCDFLADKPEERLDKDPNGWMAFLAVRIEEIL